MIRIFLSGERPQRRCRWSVQRHTMPSRNFKHCDTPKTINYALGSLTRSRGLAHRPAANKSVNRSGSFSEDSTDKMLSRMSAVRPATVGPPPDSCNTFCGERLFSADCGGYTCRYALALPRCRSSRAASSIHPAQRCRCGQTAAPDHPVLGRRPSVCHRWSFTRGQRGYSLFIMELCGRHGWRS